LARPGQQDETGPRESAFERDYAAFNETYQGFFPPDRRPARTTVGVTALAVGALVEIDCIARRPDQPTS
jgi:enamine deaminase RidA (YjgF/YER057c/UK114 family)